MDFCFSSGYMTAIALGKIVMMAIATMLPMRPVIVAVVVGAISLIMSAFSAWYRRLAGHAACNIAVLTRCKSVSFVAIAWINACILVALGLDDTESAVPLIMWGTGWGVFLLAIAIMIFLGQRAVTNEQRLRAIVRKRLLELEVRTLPLRRAAGHRK